MTGKEPGTAGHRDLVEVGFQVEEVTFPFGKVEVDILVKLCLQTCIEHEVQAPDVMRGVWA